MYRCVKLVLTGIASGAAIHIRTIFLGILKKLLSNLLLFIANVLVKAKYGVGENTSDIINTHSSEGVKVNSIHGMSKVAAVHMKTPSKMYQLRTEDGHELKAADEHIVYKEGHLTGSGIPVAMQNLMAGDILLCKDRPAKIEEIKNIPGIFTFDLSVVNQTNSYWSEGIMSHNSVTTAIFMVWYILSNMDKTIVCLSQNEDKVTDLIEKIKTIIKNLPYHLKPGVTKWDVLSMYFDNGCKIKGQTTTPNSAAGITADVLYMDEFALVNKNFIKEFYRTAYPTIAAMKNSKIIITSTPRGLNKFWEIFDGALKGKNHYNPLRIDWWEVPGRDEKWKAQEIANMGSLEDFNQEYGNQFLAGNSMLLPEPELKKVKLYECEFIHHDFDQLDEADIPYKGILTWHPFFETKELDNPEAYFALKIDLGGGDGGDYSVINIHQILPMTIDEMKHIEYFIDEKDFFKQVQIGILACNTLDVPQFADMAYKLVTSLFRLDNFKIVLEVNYDGKRFIEHFVAVHGPRNVLDEDFHFVKYRHRVDDKVLKSGIKMTEPVKKALCSQIKDRIKFGQLVVCEKGTVLEMLNFTKNDNGTYSATSGHDDRIMTEILATSFFDTEDFYEFIEEMMPNCPEAFLNEVERIMNSATKITRKGDGEDDDDSYDDLV